MLRFLGFCIFTMFFAYNFFRNIILSPFPKTWKQQNIFLKFSGEKFLFRSLVLFANLNAYGQKIEHFQNFCNDGMCFLPGSADRLGRFDSHLRFRVRTGRPRGHMGSSEENRIISCKLLNI